MTTTALDVYLPHQMAIIHDIALSLPPDAVLFVKEHIWQIGLRDTAFYRAILEIPNVVMVHHEIPGIDLVKQCDLVCTMTGSSGHEAAALGIPAIRYGRQGTIFVLPHVHRADEGRIEDLIRKILADDDPASRQKRRVDGATYVKAMEGFGFDLSSIDFFSRKKPLDEDEVELLSRPLKASLSWSCKARAALPQSILGVRT